MTNLSISTFAVASLMTITLSAVASESMSFVERVTDEHTLHRSGSKDSLGDLIVFVNAIYSADNRELVGRDEGYCIRVAVGKSLECSWTLELKDGQITTQGTVVDDGDSTIAITGGTGRYIGARGSLIVHPRPGKEASYEFRYQLL